MKSTPRLAFTCIFGDKIDLRFLDEADASAADFVESWFDSMTKQEKKGFLGDAKMQSRILGAVKYKIYFLKGTQSRDNFDTYFCGHLGPI